MMSEFGRNNSMKKLNNNERIIVAVIRLRVTFLIAFFGKACIEKKKMDSYTINELKKWSDDHNYSFELKKVCHPIYITGHHLVYQTNYKEITQIKISRR